MCAQLLISLGQGMPSQPSKMAVDPQRILYVLSFVMLPISMTMPSGVLLHWFTSNLFSLAQRGAIELPAFRTAVGMPSKKEL
ncbi:unnamed protein product, partial [Discosporangium mesarthrocarpum]